MSLYLPEPRFPHPSMGRAMAQVPWCKCGALSAGRRGGGSQGPAVFPSSVSGQTPGGRGPSLREEGVVIWGHLVDLLWFLDLEAAYGHSPHSVPCLPCRPTGLDLAPLMSPGSQSYLSITSQAGVVRISPSEGGEATLPEAQGYLPRGSASATPMSSPYLVWEGQWKLGQDRAGNAQTMSTYCVPWTSFLLPAQCPSLSSGQLGVFLWDSDSATTSHSAAVTCIPSGFVAAQEGERGPDRVLTVHSPYTGLLH
jgi:hypothetical protein